MCSSKPPVSVSFLWITILALVSTGCSGDLTSGGGGFGRLFEPKGEPWTIRCLVLTGPSRRETAESVADTLRTTQGISRRAVRVEHDEDRSMIYYGRYHRRIDSRTRRLEVTDRMDQDMRMLKALGVPGQGHYFADARFVPLPTEDLGNPAWSLDRATAVYSLRVAVFANEPGFYERKQAAAQYAALLRREGHTAFYHHGAIHSEVYVGEFGEDAVQPAVAPSRAGNDERSGVLGFDARSPEVHALQAERDFACELWNLHRRGERIGDRMVFAPSQLVRIRGVLEEGEW